MLPVRKTLPHGTPPWIRDGAIFFITICTQPRGVNQLCQPETGAWIHESFQFREQRGDWWVHLLLLMPDHLHAVLSFAQEPDMTHSISQWKRFAARERGLQWQRDFFEHRLRDDDNRVEKAHYIRMNPVRAGLVAKPEAWPYAWSKGWERFLLLKVALQLMMSLGLGRVVWRRFRRKRPTSKTQTHLLFW